MRTILVIELEDDVNLNDVKIRYAIQDKYGMPIKAEVNGCPLKPLPQKLEVKVDTFDDIMHTEFQMTDVIANIRFETDKLVALGWNACLDAIEGEGETE